MQQFEIRETTTLKLYFDWFLQNINVTSKDSDEEKEKLHKLDETAHRKFPHLITPMYSDLIVWKDTHVVEFHDKWTLW